MIVKRVIGDIFKTPLSNIAFAVNTDGDNDSGFAGKVTKSFWLELERTGGNKLGEVLTQYYRGKTFYAIVCHELAPGGWSQTPKLVEQCLNSIPGDDEIAIVLMGSGYIGKVYGADVKAILAAMERSVKRIHVYSLEGDF